MTENVGPYHLAYCKHYADAFRQSTSAPLIYALVPVETGPFVGYVKFETTSDAGRPCEPVHASHYDLLSVRQAEVRVGTADTIERQLIQVLQGRATRAGFVLPSIVATQLMPGWSKMVLPREVVLSLRRVGGA